MSASPLAALVSRFEGGDAAAAVALTEAITPELRRLAHAYLGSERQGHTLLTNDLIQEAWLRLFSSAQLSVNNRTHLVALMATQMRRVLVDHARHRNAAKGPGGSVRVTLTTNEQPGLSMNEDVLAIDQALDGLSAVDERAARVVELRFFGGLSEDEAAKALSISVATLKRDWTFARAWLFERLRSA